MPKGKRLISSFLFRIGRRKIISDIRSERDENGFFNKTIMARVDRALIYSPSTVDCILQINGTNYIKRKQFIYYGG